MNPVIKLLFYKTYEDRLSKLRIISIAWFVILFIMMLMAGTPFLAALFSALAATVPLFSIGLILRILIFDDKQKEAKPAETNKTEAKTDNTEAKPAETNKIEAKTDNAEAKPAETNKIEAKTDNAEADKKEEVKTIDDMYSAEDSQNAYMEKDNVGTRQDSLEKANAYWLGTRLQMTEKPPFSLYVFKSATDAENALLELPFIHKAKDTGNLICEKVLEFGYYKVEADNYEAIITGFDYTLDDFNKAEESFKKHNGVLKNNLEPTDNANKTASVGGDKNNVKFRETITENQFTYECYDGKTKADAMAFLKDKEVNKGLYYVCVYTPEGNFGRDINGIYEM